MKYVNENMDPISDKVILQVHFARISVQHYVTRSIQEYNLKMKRGSGHSQYARLSRWGQLGNKLSLYTPC